MSEVLDPGHREKLEKTIDRLIWSPQQLKALGTYATQVRPELWKEFAQYQEGMGASADVESFGHWVSAQYPTVGAAFVRWYERRDH